MFSFFKKEEGPAGNAKPAGWLPFSIYSVLESTTNINIKPINNINTVFIKIQIYHF